MKLKNNINFKKVNSLEAEVKNGRSFVVQSSDKAYGFDLGWSSNETLKQGVYCEDSFFKDAFFKFGKLFSIKMPSLREFPDINMKVDDLLKYKYKYNSSMLKLNLVWGYDFFKKEYVSKLVVCKKRWDLHFEQGSIKPFLPRDLAVGKSKKNFTKAYSEMGEEILTL